MDDAVPLPRTDTRVNILLYIPMNKRRIEKKMTEENFLCLVRNSRCLFLPLLSVLTVFLKELMLKRAQESKRGRSLRESLRRISRGSALEF